jgi:hypothetical protein
MSLKTEQSNSVEIIEQLDELTQSLIWATQKSLSMINLGVPKEEAFAEVFILMDMMSDMFKLIPSTDSTTKLIALSKITQAFDEFESKLDQIK